MAERKTIPPKLRFEVFKRDSFTCQYCGLSAPDVILQVDHIKPVSKEGETDILNLITSCKDCNIGKGGRELSDDAVVKKRKAQLDELQERREQIDMMLEWQRGLAGIGDASLETAAALWKELVPGYHLNEKGLDTLKKHLRRFGLAETMEGMRLGAQQYLQIVDGKPTQDSVEKAFDFVPRICVIRKSAKDKPYMQDLYYIRGIIKNKCVTYYPDRAIALLEDAAEWGVPVDVLRRTALRIRNWSSWIFEMNELIDAYSKGAEDEDG